MTENNERQAVTPAFRQNQLLREHSEFIQSDGIQIERLGSGVATLRIKPIVNGDEFWQRSVLMVIVDSAMYAAVCSTFGERSYLTSQISINFLNQPPSTELIAECKILRTDSLIVVGHTVVFPTVEPGNTICISTGTCNLH